MTATPARLAPHHEPESGRLEIGDGSGGAILRVRAVPRAGHTRVTGVRAGALVVRLAAAPADGAANAALRRFLADQLDVPSRSVVLLSGARSRDKRIQIAGQTAARVAARLEPLLAPPPCPEGRAARP